MKRMFYIALLVLATAAAISAQQRRPPGWSRWGPTHGIRPKYDHRHSSPRPGYSQENPATIRELVTVTGSLELIDGNIALRQDTITYYIKGIERLIGFIDGLKEGAEVSLDGYALRLPGEGDRRVLLVSKLGINGKTYDNLTPALTGRPEKNPPPHPGPGRRRDPSWNPAIGPRNSEESPDSP
jgi:hypothetical protein